MKKDHIQYSKQLDNYIQMNHSNRNKYINENSDFIHKLRNLMKSIYKADKRDETLSNFTDTEYMLMKSFFKHKTTPHDLKYLMVENILFLNIIIKLSKYLKKI